MADRLELLRTFFEQKVPFNRFLGMRLTELSDGFARLELPFRPELIGNTRLLALHGGTISSLIDTAGSVATVMSSEAIESAPTIDLRVDYLLPAKPETLIVEARVVRSGGRISVVDSRAFHASAVSETVATGKGVYNVHRRRGSED